MGRRAVSRSVIFISLILLIGSLLAWRFLAAWVPTRGKAWLEAALEEQLPIDLSIGAMRYEPWRGLSLEQVRAVDRETQQLWFSAPTIRAQVGWFSLLYGQVAFSAHAPIEVPCQAEISVSGRYRLRAKSLTLDVRTSEVSLATLSAPLRQRLPAPLSDGLVRLGLHIMSRPTEALRMTGQVAGTRLVWVTPSLRLRGDVTLDGRASAPDGEGPWAIDLLATLRDGTLEGLPTVQTVSQLRGTARIRNDALELQELRGTVLGSEWRIEGRVAPLTQPAVELLISSRAELAPLAERWLASPKTWQLSGPADIEMVCRGPLQPAPTIATVGPGPAPDGTIDGGPGPTPFLDCLATAQIQDVQLTGSRLSHPIDHIAGRLAYDALARELTIQRLEGRLMDEALSVQGEMVLRDPIRLSISVSGVVPLEAVKGWLPPEGPITSLGGAAALDIHLDGPLTALSSRGEIGLKDLSARLKTFPETVDGLTGLVILSPDRIELRQLALRCKEEALTLSATVTAPPERPLSFADARLVATVGSSRGRLGLTAHLTPDELVIDDGQLALERSRMQVQGRLSRSGERPSLLRLTGGVELSELSGLPFLPLPAVERWHLRGWTDADVEFQGRFADWQGATISGRFTAERLSLREVPVEQLTCEVEQRDQTLRARVPSALVADGRFTGELSVEHVGQRADYLLQADLTGLQLTRLTTAIPAWQSRGIMGMASSHALLSGTWGRRASWGGEGWINASGDRLGEMPLLDKLFRRLFGVLGDRLGLETLRRAQITDASVRWQLREERFRTDDLRLAGLAGSEPVAIYAKGSVGLDQTLDFTIEPEFSEQIVLEAPNTSSLAAYALKAAGQLDRFRRLIGRHHLTGTLKEPDYRFEFSPGDALKQVAPGPADLLRDILDTLR